MSIVKRTLLLVVVLLCIMAVQSVCLAEKKQVGMENIDYDFVVYEKVRDTFFAPLDKLELHLAGNEQETIPLYFEFYRQLWPSAGNNKVSIKASELVGANGKLPAPQMRFQGRLTSGTGEKYLTYEGRSHDYFQGYKLLASNDVLITLGRTETLWLTYTTWGVRVRPGVYRGTISFHDDRGKRLIKEIAVEAIVHEFSIPQCRLVEYFPAYSIAYIVAGPEVPEDKRLGLWELHCRELTENGCRRVSFYASSDNKGLLARLVRVSHMEKGYLPRLDFSGLDPYMDIAGKYGMDGAFIYYSYDKSWKGKPERELTEQEKAQRDSHIWQQWFAYLRRKGLGDIILKTYDEPSTDFADEKMLASLRATHDLDHNVRMGGFYNKIGLESFNAVHPYVEMYVVMAHCADTFFGWIRAGKFVPKQGDILGYYIPSRYMHATSYLSCRMELWHGQRLNVRFFHQWAYDLTHGDYGHINYNAPDLTEIVSTPAWEGTKDGLEDWELCEQLKDRIVLIRKKGLAKQADQLQARLDSLISDQQGKSPIRSSPEFKRGYKYTVLSSDVPSLRRAKKIVLESLVRAQEILDSK